MDRILFSSSILTSMLCIYFSTKFNVFEINCTGLSQTFLVYVYYKINKDIIHMTDDKDNAITCVRCIRHVVVAPHANNGACAMV